MSIKLQWDLLSRTILQVTLSVMMCSLWQSPASAFDERQALKEGQASDYGFEELVSGEIEFSPPPELLKKPKTKKATAAMTDGCELNLDTSDSNTWKIENLGSCEIFKKNIPPGGNGDISVSANGSSVTLKFKPKRKNKPFNLENNNGHWNTPKGSEFYYFDNSESKWKKAKTEQDVMKSSLEKETPVYLLSGHDYQKVESPKSNGSDQDCSKSRHGAVFQCPLPLSNKPFRSFKPNTVCVTIDEHNEIYINTTLPHVIGPNTSISTIVRRLKGTQVSVSMGGSPGIFTPGLHQSTIGQANAKNPCEETKNGEPREWIESTHSFAPRLPGKADLTVEVRDPNDPRKILGSKTYEIIVDKTYIGALRLGFGVVFADALDASYKGQKLPGSEQYEVIAEAGGKTDFELVVGFAPFAFDFISGGKGRRYINQPLKKRAMGFAPFIGTGLLAVDKKGTEFLKSLHLGIEWEPLPEFSVAVTAVGRRVQRLSGNLKVGSAVEGTSVPTRTGLNWGVSLVLNVTPEFFRFASKDSAKLLAGETSK